MYLVCFNTQVLRMSVCGCCAENVTKPESRELHFADSFPIIFFIVTFGCF